MLEVFYGTSVPEQQRDEKAEFYTLVCAFAPAESFVVMHRHGWWDHERNCSRCDETVIATVDSEVEAKRIYGEERAKLLSMGFVRARSGLWTVPASASAPALVEA